MSDWKQVYRNGTEKPPDIDLLLWTMEEWFEELTLNNLEVSSKQPPKLQLGIKNYIETVSSLPNDLQLLVITYSFKFLSLQDNSSLFIDVMLMLNPDSDLTVTLLYDGGLKVVSKIIGTITVVKDKAFKILKMLHTLKISKFVIQSPFYFPYLSIINRSEIVELESYSNFRYSFQLNVLSKVTRLKTISHAGEVPMMLVNNLPFLRMLAIKLDSTFTNFHSLVITATKINHITVNCEYIKTEWLANDYFITLLRYSNCTIEVDQIRIPTDRQTISKLRAVHIKELIVDRNLGLLNQFTNVDKVTCEIRPITGFRFENKSLKSIDLAFENETTYDLKGLAALRSLSTRYLRNLKTAPASLRELTLKQMHSFDDFCILPASLTTLSLYDFQNWTLKLSPHLRELRLINSFIGIGENNKLWKSLPASLTSLYLNFSPETFRRMIFGMTMNENIQHLDVTIEFIFSNYLVYVSSTNETNFDLIEYTIPGFCPYMIFNNLSKNVHITLNDRPGQEGNFIGSLEDLDSLTLFKFTSPVR